MDAQQFERLQRKVEGLKRDKARAEGALALVMEELKTEHGCSTLEEAETLLDEREDAAVEAKQKYEKALAAFESEWGEQLS